MRKEMIPCSRNWKELAAFIVLPLVCYGLLGLAIVPEAKAEKGKQTLVLDVVPSAQVEKVSYYFKKFKGKETIHFVVMVKNISSEPKRFKVLISIDDGPSTAYYYPRKGKPPVIKPGAAWGKPLPLVFYDKAPEGILVKVSEM
jgi:hypothetical protein